MEIQAGDELRRAFLLLRLVAQSEVDVRKGYLVSSDRVFDALRRRLNRRQKAQIARVAGK